MKGTTVFIPNVALLITLLILMTVLPGCNNDDSTTPSTPPPAPDTISPTSGPIDGGTTVTITGSGFVTGATTSFGGTASSDVSVTSETSITAITPAHSEGAADVVVTNPDGQSGRITDGFTYETVGIKIGLWEGNNCSFRVTSSTSLTFLSTNVPTFSNPSGGCTSSWNQEVAIDSTSSFSADLTDSDSNTSLNFSGNFESNTHVTGTFAGVCKGSLVLLGQTFNADWVSN